MIDGTDDPTPSTPVSKYKVLPLEYPEPEDWILALTIIPPDTTTFAVAPFQVVRPPLLKIFTL